MELEIILPSNMRQAWRDKCHVICVTLKRPLSELKRAERAVSVGETVGDGAMGTKMQSEGLWGGSKAR